MTEVIKPHGSMHFFELRDEMHQLLGGPRIAAVSTGFISEFNPARQAMDIKRGRAWDLLQPTPIIVPSIFNKETYLASNYFREMLGLTYARLPQLNEL